MKNQGFLVELIEKDSLRYYLIRDGRTGQVLDIANDSSELATFLSNYDIK